MIKTLIRVVPGEAVAASSAMVVLLLTVVPLDQGPLHENAGALALCHVLGTAPT